MIPYEIEYKLTPVQGYPKAEDYTPLQFYKYITDS